MFERLITPLRARFEPSPLPEASFEVIEDHETASAENFARDVLIEIMRNSVESLKEAEDLKAKIEVCSQSSSLHYFSTSFRSWARYRE